MNTKKATDNSFLDTLKNGFTNSPFEKAGKDYNIAGALLFGAGTGLTSWALSRMLGLRGGASLGASILAGLAGTHVALSSQSGQGPFSMKYWEDLMGGKPVSSTASKPTVDPLQAAMDRFRTKTNAHITSETVAPPVSKSDATSDIMLSSMTNEQLMEKADTLKSRGLSNTPLARKLIDEMNMRSLIGYTGNEPIDQFVSKLPDETIQNFADKTMTGDQENNALYQMLSAEAARRGIYTAEGMEQQELDQQELDQINEQRQDAFKEQLSKKNQAFRERTEFRRRRLAEFREQQRQKRLKEESEMSPHAGEPDFTKIPSSPQVTRLPVPSPYGNQSMTPSSNPHSLPAGAPVQPAPISLPRLRLPQIKPGQSVGYGNGLRPVTDPIDFTAP